MYYSEFTIRLIEKVKKHEILYNTKYEKRPKSEKEEAWTTIGNALNENPDKCKKHWKNVRDRFVKVKHQRDKHFQRGGSELDAPAKYLYFEHLEFMREFTVNKEIPVDTIELLSSPNISPDQLLYEQSRDNDSNLTFLDYTSKFIEIVKDFPELYDELSELRRYRSKGTWKRIAEMLGGRFSVGQLRLYWTQLMKKFKVYLEGYHKYHCAIEYEEIFDQMSFASIGVQLKQDHAAYKEEQIFDEEHLVCEEQDDEAINSDYDDLEASSVLIADSKSKKRNCESENESEPETKKRAITLNTSSDGLVTHIKSPSPGPAGTYQSTSDLNPPTKEDEFDYFGKKVALQLRELAQRDRKVARKGEIQVLQLLLELEESLDSGFYSQKTLFPLECSQLSVLNCKK